jgi:glycosyltransferase involved in cell wall biosynthesis
MARTKTMKGNEMRFHIFGLPHTKTNQDYTACAYTAKVLKFARMATQAGHTVIHYGHPDSELECTEHVNVISRETYTRVYGQHPYKNKFFRYDINDEAYQEFYRNAIAQVAIRKQANDFLLPFWGVGHKPITDAFPDLITVEPGIGYAGGHWARWKIFESYAIYHAYCGLHSVGNCKQDNYEVVIPNYFDPDDFTYNSNKQDYVLFLGRVYSGKGLDIAIQATKAAGMQLKIAGQGSMADAGYTTIPDHVEYIGYADRETRRELMANAKCAFVASQYVEPFGGVQIENLLSGTPTITSDWGSFTENNIHGVTGYRCRTFEQYVWALMNIDKINPQDCRDFAINNFSLDAVWPKYEEYFQMVLDVYTGKGWYQEHEINTIELTKKWIPNGTL